MSVLEDITFYVALLTDSDLDTRVEAHAMLIEIGKPAMLGLPAAICRFRLSQLSYGDMVVEEVFKTMQTIGTDEGRHMLAFMTHATEAKDFWSDAVKSRAQTILNLLGEPPPLREGYPVAAIVTQFFIFLLGSENSEERSAAQTILVNQGSANWSLFTEALEHGKYLYSEDIKRDYRLYQFKHPRPQEVIDTLKMLGTENCRAALLWMADNKEKKWEAEIQSLARAAAESMIITAADSKKSNLALLQEYTAAVDEAPARNCFVCGKSVSRDDWIEYERAVFCSSECYQKAKRDPSYWM